MINHDTTLETFLEHLSQAVGLHIQIILLSHPQRAQGLNSRYDLSPGTEGRKSEGPIKAVPKKGASKIKDEEISYIRHEYRKNEKQFHRTVVISEKHLGK